MSWTFTSEQDLASTFATEINPFWQTSVTLGEFVGKDNIDVHYAWCIPENPKSTVVISSGRIESYLKYKELIFDLYQNGFAVFILDHRGQGLSDRAATVQKLPARIPGSDRGHASHRIRQDPEIQTARAGQRCSPGAGQARLIPLI